MVDLDSLDLHGAHPVGANVPVALAIVIRSRTARCWERHLIPLPFSISPPSTHTFILPLSVSAPRTRRGMIMFQYARAGWSPQA